MELKIEYLPIKALKPYEKNTRKHQKKDVDNIARSIEKYGMCDAIGIWSDKNIIVEGHGRMLACKQLGITEVPCVRLDHLTDEQRREYAIAHNATAELSEWDFDILPDELAELDLSDFDFDFGIEDEEEETEIVEDEAPEVDEENEPITKLGDIWQLGRHRLMCGDSTDLESVEKLMEGQLADMLLTDPPYNVALGMGGSVDEARKRHRRTDGLVIMNDKMEDGEFYSFLLSMYSCAKENLKEGASFYIWHADNEGLNFRKALRDAGLQLRQTLIWNKNAITLGRQDYQWKHEPCLYGWKDGASHNWYSDRSQATVLDFKRPSRSEQHPTMKPVELFAYQIKCSSKKKDIVLDLFGGSGTTIIACEQTERCGYLMELDPKYCDVIIKRWETLTGEKAVLIND